MQQFHKFITWR